jgi:hypothetical protein
MLVHISFAVYYAVAIQSWYLHGLTYISRTDAKQWKKPVRLILASSISAPLLILLLLTPEQIPNPYFYSLLYGLSPFASFLTFFCLTDKICERVGLYT